MEKSLFLQRLIQFLVGLGQGDIQHSYESLLNARRSIVQRRGEIAARKRSKYCWEQSRVELADMGNRDCRGDLERFIAHCVVDMEEKRDDVEVCKGASCTDRLRCNIFNRLARIESDNLVFSRIQALNEDLDG